MIIFQKKTLTKYIILLCCTQLLLLWMMIIGLIHGLLIMDHCHSLLVLQLPKWQDSKGLDLEIKQAKERNMEINYIDLPQIEIICNNNKFIPFLKDKS